MKTNRTLLASVSAITVALGANLMTASAAHAAECLLDTTGNKVADDGEDTVGGAQSAGGAPGTVDTSTLACGAFSVAGQSNAMAFGYHAEAPSSDSIAIGAFAHTRDTSTTAIGTRAYADGFGASVFGFQVLSLIHI